MTSKLYEAMFLVDSAEAGSDWGGVEKSITNILKRVEAEIVLLRKWDERRLAYDINGQSRGTYILCYFRANGRRIRDIERAVQLSEKIMRVLILCAEGREEKDIEKETPATLADKSEQESSEPAAGATKQETAPERSVEAAELKTPEEAAKDETPAEGEKSTEDEKPVEDEKPAVGEEPSDGEDTAGQEAPAKEPS
ncbi:MAG: 30S ribosomal protein S6 [Planctomycetota bacterium]|jgi:small subunit ribosomal protein S6